MSRGEPFLLLADRSWQDLRRDTRAWSAWTAESLGMLVVEKVAAGYFYLATLAPFPRSSHLAREYISMELIRSGVLSEPILPISRWLRKTQDQHADVVLGMAVRQDMDALVRYIAGGVIDICDQQITLLARLNNACDEMMDRAVKKTAVVRLITALVTTPLLDMKKIASICEISDVYARRLARELQNAGIVEILDGVTLEPQTEGSVYGKVISASQIMRALGVLQPHSPTTDDDVLL